MALFSKPPAKKPAPGSAKAAAAPNVRDRPVSARELAAKAAGMPGAKSKLEPVPAGEPTTGTSLIEWSPQQRDAIEPAKRRAWAEFTAQRPELRFVPFVATAEAQSFIFVE